MMRKHVAPLIAMVLLLLPLLYVGSYLALVEPRGIVQGFPLIVNPDGSATLGYSHPVLGFYRSRGEWEKRVYWPLEQMDRRLRPNAWHDGFVRIGVDFD